MTARQRAGLVLMLLGLTMMVINVGQDSMEIVRTIRIVLYFLVGAVMFVARDRKE